MIDTSKLTTREQVKPHEIAELAAQGCTTLINNRPDNEGPDQPSSHELQAEAQRHGITYYHIPVVPGEATEAAAHAFAEAVRQANGKVVAFCRTGMRAAALQKMADEIERRER